MVLSQGDLHGVRNQHVCKVNVRSIYTQTKSHDHKNLRDLENHPKAKPW
jgi:hypothetical protein